MRKINLILIVSLILFATTYALPPLLQQEVVTASKVLGASTVDNTTFFDANNILCFVNNNGGIARDLSGVFGYDAGFFFPYVDTASINDGSYNDYCIYAAGLWLGGKANGELCVTVAEFSHEYVPGPMAGGTYLPDEPSFRVYKLYSDSLADNPNNDYINWPDDQGAPTDALGDPLLTGDQTLWSVYNDADPDQHNTNSGGTEPLGIEVQQTVWGSDEEGEENVMYIKYKLYNRGSINIDSFYISFWVDPDLGGAGDDFVGCDSINNIFFCYNADNDDTDYGSTPPATGGRVVSGPVVPSTGDTAVFDGKPLPNHKNIGMTSFNMYINGIDPDDAVQSFNFMRGLNRGGGVIYDQSNGFETKYVCSGNPITGTGWLDENSSDRRMMTNFGPLTFNPGDSQQVVIKLGAAMAEDRLSSLSDLLNMLKDSSHSTSVAQNRSNLPYRYHLYQNNPNPFNVSTLIGYSLKNRADVSISVYNILGRKITSLVNKSMPAGSHIVKWDGTNSEGESVASGMYFYRINAGDFIDTKKMLLLK